MAADCLRVLFKATHPLLEEGSSGSGRKQPGLSILGIRVWCPQCSNAIARLPKTLDVLGTENLQ